MAEEIKVLAPAGAAEPDAPTTDLVREALDETRELVRLEVALAREEVKSEITQAKTAGVVLGAAGALGISAFTMFMVAIASAWAWTWLAALIIAGILMSMAGVLAFAGWSELPTKPLPETRERLQTDLRQLRERVA